MAKYVPKYQKPAAPKRRRQKWIVPVLFSTVVVALVVTVGLTWNSVAKYFESFSRDDAAVKAKEFYFTSDYLTPEGKTYTLTPGADGTVDVTFELRNYDGLNKSELDIGYTVTIQPNVDITYHGDKSINVRKVIDGQVIEGEAMEKVTLENLEAGQTYTVTATGENGYQQTLRATFVVDPVVTGLFKNTKNYGDYVLLTIWAEDEGGTVKFTVPSGLIPDATDDMLTGKDVDSEITVVLNAHESRTFRFFTTSTYAGGVIEVQGLPETTLN